eukprot:CAMPEP_0173210314 /NCGR_PEP_ID=MMETSP1141-20130122/23589_1 /TAXON_ID=483371 /ORGANISM="non described non described, Strain CCMP2298" /LENGTH=228 /DNA_ID=CAMNT_0014137035 /DNA_START=29 /DNA_END=718 /DNA_ORIENTATION=+
MIARFNELMQGQYVEQTPLTANNMMGVVASSVTASLSNSLSSSSRTDGTTKTKDFVIDAAVPDWAGLQVKYVISVSAVSVSVSVSSMSSNVQCSNVTIIKRCPTGRGSFCLVLPNQQAERAVLFKVRPPTSVAALWEEADDKSAVEDFPHPDAVQLLVAPRPFAQGAVRLAYHAQELPTATAVSGAAATALGYMGSVYSGLGFVQGFAQASSPSPTPCASAGAGLTLV